MKKIFYIVLFSTTYIQHVDNCPIVLSNRGMLQIYRRHGPGCKFKLRSETSCNCVIRVEGVLNDKFIRASTKTRSWKKAESLRRRAEAIGTWSLTEAEPDPSPAKSSPTFPTVDEAIEKWLTECEKESGGFVSERSIGAYRSTFNRLSKYASQAGITHIDGFSEAAMIAFKDTWDFGQLTTVHTITRLRTFGNFCVDRGWWTVNFALKLKKPRNLKQVERIPFDEERKNGSPSEMDRILEAARTVVLRNDQVSNFELETFILVMRHTGMAICDATLLKDSEVLGDRVRYFRKKTLRRANRILVEVALPKFLQERLSKLKNQRGLVGRGKKYYFCHDSEVMVKAAKVWHGRLQRVFELAGIRGSSHQFRHTFATYWLTAGVDPDTVARWLGHANPATTRKYYSHWIRPRIDAANQIMFDHYERLEAKLGTA